jgi:dolichol-phosphate mannosyltransferase
MIYIVLPAYNEEPSLDMLLSRIKAVMRAKETTYKVILVNDGSTDNTLEIARMGRATMPIYIVDHGHNQGLGAALKSGLLKASSLAQPEDVIVTMDADNTHTPELIWPMVEKLADGYDVIVASRYTETGDEIGLSFHRRLLSRGASTVLRLLFPIRGISDYTCGYRAYRAAILMKAIGKYGELLVQEQGFTCMVEVLLKLRKCNVRASEVPLVLRYDLKAGASKMRVIKTVLRYVVLISNNLVSPGTRPFRNVPTT